MKKSFKIGEKGKAAKATYQGSPLDLILGEDIDNSKQVNETPKQIPQPEAQKRAIEKPVKKTETKRKSSKSANQKTAVNKVEIPIDKRRVEDKKEPFSTVLRGSLQKELKEILKQYRQEVDFEYNKAQFMEDAILKHIKYLRKQFDIVG